MVELNIIWRRLQEFEAFNCKVKFSTGTHSRISVVCKWNPPVSSFLKLNVDASIKKDDGVIAVVMRDSNVKE